MKVTGERLIELLESQRETVELVDPAGTTRRGISSRFAATEIAGGEFVGYGRGGLVERVVSTQAPRRGPFATRQDLAVIGGDFPRLPHVQKNTQARGAKEWAPQPAFAATGQRGQFRTLYLGSR